MQNIKRLKIKKTISKEELSYIAGLIDGEGHIGLHKAVEYRRKIITQSYQPLIKISMTDPEGIDLMKDCFGGKIDLIIKNNPKHKNQYLWQIAGKQDVKNILILLLPYLRVKRKHALLVLDYIELRIEKRKSGWKNTYDEKEKNFYIEYKNLMGGKENSIY